MNRKYAFNINLSLPLSMFPLSKSTKNNRTFRNPASAFCYLALCFIFRFSQKLNMTLSVKLLLSLKIYASENMLLLCCWLRAVRKNENISFWSRRTSTLRVEAVTFTFWNRFKGFIFIKVPLITIKILNIRFLSLELTDSWEAKYYKN